MTVPSDRKEAVREAVGNYITALMVDGGANVAACERAMEEALDSLVAERAAAVAALREIAAMHPVDSGLRGGDVARAALAVCGSPDSEPYDWTEGGMASAPDVDIIGTEGSPLWSVYLVAAVVAVCIVALLVYAFVVIP